MFSQDHEGFVSPPCLMSPCSAGFINRLDRLKPRASKFRGPPAKVYNSFITVFELLRLCCHNVVYFLNNPSVTFLTQLKHCTPISEYCRILNTPHHPRLYSNLLNTLLSSSSRVGGELGGASKVEQPTAFLYLNLALDPRALLRELPCASIPSAGKQRLPSR